MSGAQFVGVGVGHYDEGRRSVLDRAVPDVQEFAARLGEAFRCEVLADPDEAAVLRLVRGVRGTMPEGGSLVLMWCGHANVSADGLRLLARDSGEYDTDGLPAGEVAGPCAESGASQVLIIVDTCFSGGAVDAGQTAARILQKIPPAGEHVWVGVLTSCLPAETARDGLFGPRLARLLAKGPVTPSCGCGGRGTACSSAGTTCATRC